MTKLAECVGLWLAEGNNKTIAEITFTNNSWLLVKQFSEAIYDLFKNREFKPRIYVYSKNNEKIKINIKNHIIRYYVDQRAKKPYFIFRLASRNCVKDWKNLVEEIKKNSKLHPSILRGFFAGEGNIKTGSHSNKTLRIAQGKPNKFLENMLDVLKIKYVFSNTERSYVITGKWNWDIFVKHKLPDLHPDKKEKFWAVYKSYKEIHYPNFYLKFETYRLLEKPKTSLELSLNLSRSQARIYDVLAELEKENKVIKFKVRSKTYWTRNKNQIVISDVKNKYLTLLNSGPLGVNYLAKKLKVDRKSAYKRLKELEKLELIRKSGVNWMIKPNKKEVIVL